jgi:hypothetical protein
MQPPRVLAGAGRRSPALQPPGQAQGPAAPRDAAADAATLGGSGLFDAAWYRHSYPDVAQAGLDPLVHFVRHGWQEGRRPNPWFDPAWYRRNNPDLAAAAINPLLHYLHQGDAEGRRPRPHFDPAWYRLSQGLPADAPALAHFLVHRTSGRHAPSAALYAARFLPGYRDDPAAGLDPYRHFLDDCAAAARDPFPDPILLAGTGLLDANHYLVNGSDVHAAQLDPVQHFCRFGWQEHRRPNIYFDTGWYLATNPRVAALGLNPLVHYACEGEAADRRPVPYFDPGWYRATYGIPAGQSALAHFLAHRRSQAFSPTPLFDVAWYVARHAEALGPHRDPFAHFLLAGTQGVIDPSPDFDAAAYRRRHLGRPSRGFRHLMQAEQYNPLIHHLRAEYR